MFVIQVTPSLFPAQLRRKTVRHPFRILISLNNLDISNIRIVYCQDFYQFTEAINQGAGEKRQELENSFSVICDNF